MQFLQRKFYNIWVHKEFDTQIEKGEFMLKQSEIDQWLADFLKRLRKSFGERLILVGLHGSWARGGAETTSSSLHLHYSTR